MLQPLIGGGAATILRTLLNSGIAYKRLELPKLTLYAPCNPSILARGWGLLCVYRGCNYFLRRSGYNKFYGSWTSPITDSQNYIAEITDDLECLRADLVEDRHSRARNDCLDGILDLRLFAWRGELFAAGAGCNYRSKMEKKTRRIPASRKWPVAITTATIDCNTRPIRVSWLGVTPSRLKKRATASSTPRNVLRNQAVITSVVAFPELWS